MRKLRSALLICAAVLVPFGAAAQHADYVARQRIAATVAGLSDPLTPGALSQAAGAVMAGVGLAWIAPDVPEVAVQPIGMAAGAVIELVDIRLLLTQIAIQTGAQDHTALVRAQGDREHDVILLRGGHVGLSEMAALAQGTPAQDFVMVTPNGVVLTRPLAIWSDAGLILTGPDRLILDRASGSFVANLGRIEVSSGAISGNEGSNTAVPGFRPFVMTAGQGSFTARDATLSALGFGDVAVFGGVSVANNGLVAAPHASAIIDSTLMDVRTVGLIGTTGARLTGNRVEGAGGTAILVSAAMDTVVADNSLSGMAGTQGIRVTAGSAHVQVSGNLLSGAARTGILIDRNSRGVNVIGNLVTGSQTTGIGVNGADCVLLNGNLVAGNGASGISLTNTDGTTLRANAVLFNAGSGLLVRNQASMAEILLAENVLMGNRNGLRGATVGRVAMSGNDLDGQIPQVFTGDFAPLAVDWLRARRGAKAEALPVVAALPCPIAGEG